MGPTAARKEFYLTLVRHGQTVANVNKVIQGHSDTPLTELGGEQARALAAYFHAHGPRHFQRVYTSDLGRAQYTCRLVLDHLEELQAADCVECERRPASQEPQLSELLRERRYGSYFEGKPIAVLQAEAFKLGFDGSTFTRYAPPEAESMEQVQARVRLFCESVLWREPNDADEVLVVSHWATIKEFLRLLQPLAALQAGPQIEPQHLLETPNLAFSRFSIAIEAASSPAQVQVLSLHQTVHLRSDQISVNLRQALS